MKVDDGLVQQAFAEVDKDRNHKITWLELWSALAPTPMDVLRELRFVKNKRRLTVSELIRPYDSNADDLLTAGEFHRMLDGLGFDLDDGEVRDLVRQIDLDGTRQVSRKDLEHALDHWGGAWKCIKTVKATQMKKREMSTCNPTDGKVLGALSVADYSQRCHKLAGGGSGSFVPCGKSFDILINIRYVVSQRPSYL